MNERVILGEQLDDHNYIRDSDQGGVAEGEWPTEIDIKE